MDDQRATNQDVDTDERSAPIVAAPSSISLPLLLFLMVWPVVVAASAAFWVQDHLQKQWAADQALHPPIAVLNMGQIVREQNPGGGAGDQLAGGIERAHAIAQKLRAAGFIVLNQGAVAAAPEQVVYPESQQ